MARRKANGKRFCKLTLKENGRTTTVVSNDSHRHHADPYSSYRANPDSGVHLAEMLLNPKAREGWITTRDAVWLMMGFFFCMLLSNLAEATAYSLM